MEEEEKNAAFHLLFRTRLCSTLGASYPFFPSLSSFSSYSFLSYLSRDIREDRPFRLRSGKALMSGKDVGLRYECVFRESGTGLRLETKKPKMELTSGQLPNIID